MIELDPRYRNYWLDLARKEQKEKEEAKRKKALSSLMKAIDEITNQKKKKP
jgi:hypothetical protein